MIFPDIVLVRYGEIALKDKWTRQNWEKILAGNISFNIRSEGIKAKISRKEGRIFIHTSDPQAGKIASRVFGVVSISPAQSVNPDLSEISKSAVSIASNIKPSSFAIRPRRSGGTLASEEIGRIVGEAVRNATCSSVDLDNPDLEIFVEARRDKAYIFTEIIKGMGGLPVGSQGKMLTLISGGIDSPVAAWMMMKRGCPISLLHFNAQPYADSQMQSKRSAEILVKWMSGRKINFIQVPISKGIEKIATHYPRATCILCRRLMYRIATEIIRSEGALGIVTGYSLGQVASQTTENIVAEQSGINAPIYHPLIGMDKTEIVELARKIGTYEVTEKTKSCIAVPHKPMTKANVDKILEIDEELGLKDMSKALALEAIHTKIG
ncbi:MAG: tRNA 4-thiouridine(8) synthase ThiI [Methanotrichaceae archaeon]|nr:tRNA 4-thiouridine(8) synthase ThiI [Methanotrichaceae archaeon]